MPRPKISAFVISFNRAGILGTCLRALAFADELIVVDKSSTDASASIAATCADDVITVPWTPTVEETRTLAASLCRHEWILFMDDDEHIRSLTASMLESLDYTFDLAKGGEEAITLYKRYLNIGRPYDAVIMDLTVIGGLGGEETFAVLRDLDPDVRAIVSSGYDNEEMAKQYLDMGFCGYLTKPYRVTDLGKVLKAVLG